MTPISTRLSSLEGVRQTPHGLSIYFGRILKNTLERHQQIYPKRFRLQRRSNLPYWEWYTMVYRHVVEIIRERPLFQIMFLRNDKYRSVYVDEVEEMDFEIIKKHLEKGESIFITRKGKKGMSSL
jgi:hypothetical protein